MAVPWSEYVRTLLEINGWSQAQLAETCSVTEGTISKWLSGERIPSAEAQGDLLKLGNVRLTKAKKTRRRKSRKPRKSRGKVAALQGADSGIPSG